MTDAISYDEIRAALGRMTYDRFLIYVMGPYKSFNLNYVPPEEEPAAISIDDLSGPIQELFAARDEAGDVLAFLWRVQGTLHADPGVNAFFAVDVGLSVDKTDIMTQSLAFAAASNATAFVLPFLGHNFDVGEETGSTLERPSETRDDRIVFVHETTATSEMIRAARTHWDLRVETYNIEAELHRRIRLSIADVMNRKLHGDLDRLD